jgi:hypothetical protein
MRNLLLSCGALLLSVGMAFGQAGGNPGSAATQNNGQSAQSPTGADRNGNAAQSNNLSQGTVGSPDANANNVQQSGANGMDQPANPNNSAGTPANNYDPNARTDANDGTHRGQTNPHAWWMLILALILLYFVIRYVGRGRPEHELEERRRHDLPHNAERRNEEMRRAG